MPTPALDTLPGFRRRILVTPGEHWVRAEVEDDYHCMSVTVRHDGKTATEIVPVMDRAPWTTCPGAPARLIETFTGAALEDFAMRGQKKTNCTHLHDMAVLAAAHAHDAAPSVYDILVSDPTEDGLHHAEIRRDGETLLRWAHKDFRFVEPASLAGIMLTDMNAWIAELPKALKEPARMLRWGTMMANGRTLPMERQSDASRMPPTCYTFQPERAVQAKRVGKIMDFSGGAAEPLTESRARLVQD